MATNNTAAPAVNQAALPRSGPMVTAHRNMAGQTHTTANAASAQPGESRRQAAAATPETIGFYADYFGVKRVVLPRVLSVEEIAVNLEIREVDELRAMFELREGEAYRAFQRGRLRTEAELRTAIRQAALNGSSPAQQMMISFLKSSEI